MDDTGCSGAHGQLLRGKAGMIWRRRMGRIAFCLWAVKALEIRFGDRVERERSFSTTAE